MFEPIQNFLGQVGKGFHMVPQMKAGMVCSQARKLISDNYPHFTDLWTVKKFENKTLTIQTKDHSSASELRMRTEQLLAQCRENQYLKGVAKIAIMVI
ncbi:MAG TPA: DciA family protein [Candidatus Gracilibacteria bacterium]